MAPVGLFLTIAAVALCHALGRRGLWKRIADRLPAPVLGVGYALLLALCLVFALSPRSRSFISISDRRRACVPVRPRPARWTQRPARASYKGPGKRKAARRACTAVLSGLTAFVALQLASGVAIERQFPGMIDPDYGFDSPASGKEGRRPRTDSARRHVRQLPHLLRLCVGRVERVIVPAIRPAGFRRQLGVPGAGPLTNCFAGGVCGRDGVRPILLLVEVLPGLLDRSFEVRRREREKNAGRPAALDRSVASGTVSVRRGRTSGATWRWRKPRRCTPAVSDPSRPGAPTAPPARRQDAPLFERFGPALMPNAPSPADFGRRPWTCPRSTCPS